jgi:hypothetical protein
VEVLQALRETENVIEMFIAPQSMSREDAIEYCEDLVRDVQARIIILRDEVERAKTRLQGC